MLSQSLPMMRSLLVVTATLILVRPAVATCQARQYPLESATGLLLHNVAAEPATLNGKKGVRLTISAEAQDRLQRMTAEQQNLFEQLAVIEGSDFSSGTIEVELAGTPAPGAAAGARGFVGIAFRLQKDMRTYDAFYVRPTNAARRTRSDAITPRSISPIRIGPGSGCVARRHRSMNRTSILFLANGRRSASRCAVKRLVCSYTDRNTRRSS